MDIRSAATWTRLMGFESSGSLNQPRRGAPWSNPITRAFPSTYSPRSMHRTSDSRRYREGDSFESAGDFSEFEARGGSAYTSVSSSTDSSHRGLRWRDNTGVFGSGSMLSGRRVTARRAIVLGLIGAFAFMCLPRRHEDEDEREPPPAVMEQHHSSQREVPVRTVA